MFVELAACALESATTGPFEKPIIEAEAGTDAGTSLRADTAAAAAARHSCLCAFHPAVWQARPQNRALPHPVQTERAPDPPQCQHASSLATAWLLMLRACASKSMAFRIHGMAQVPLKEGSAPSASPTSTRNHRYGSGMIPGRLRWERGDLVSPIGEAGEHGAYWGGDGDGETCEVSWHGCKGRKGHASIAARGRCDTHIQQ